MTQPLILICDDETHLREMVAEYLLDRGFDVAEAADAEAMRQQVEKRTPDLILLDIRMPKEDGLTALRTLRANRDVPVIMLTASAGTTDRVVGLELGADDYLGKPVDLRELEARIKAVLRRHSIMPQQTAPLVQTAAADNRVRFGPCALDLDAAQLFDADGLEISITSMEFTLLKLFAANPGRILTRDQILDHTHDRTNDPFDRSIDLRISRLRRKVEMNPAKPEVIRTVRGLGYIFDGAKAGNPA